jgi:hypothetical protein
MLVLVEVILKEIGNRVTEEDCTRDNNGFDNVCKVVLLMENGDGLLVQKVELMSRLEIGILFEKEWRDGIANATLTALGMNDGGRRIRRRRSVVVEEELLAILLVLTYSS